MNLDEKVEKVKNTLKNRKVAIAFSGGADSTLLAYLASEVSDDPIAITIDNHIFPTGFIKHCKKTAKEFGIRHQIIDLISTNMKIYWPINQTDVLYAEI